MSLSRVKIKITQDHKTVNTLHKQDYEEKMRKKRMMRKTMMRKRMMRKRTRNKEERVTLGLTFLFVIPFCCCYSYLWLFIMT